MRKPLRRRGFTLLELLVGAAVGAVVLLGISMTFISQAQQYQAHAGRRALQANARQGLGFMGRHLRVAGYGVNPDRAILSYDSYNAKTNAADLGFPDAFVVHWRDPLFRRYVANASPSMINLLVDGSGAADKQALTEPLRQGQILLLVCGQDAFSSGENPLHAFVTVATFVPVGATAIPLDTTAPTSAPNSPVAGPGRLFHEQDTLNQPCFSSNVAQVVKVNRAAFYVDSFDDDGDPTTPGETPYLMLHQGLDMPTATTVAGDSVIDINDAVPVAEGIEQMQVAYILHTGDTDPPIILGVTNPMGANHYGESWEQIDPLNLPTGWFFNSGLTTRFTPAELEAKRELDHPANIRQVRVTLVARSSVPEPSYAGDNLLDVRLDGTAYPDGPDLGGGNFAWRHLENLGVPTSAYTPKGGGYYRAILRESITPKNLLLNRQFVPTTVGGG